MYTYLIQNTNILNSKNIYNSTNSWWKNDFSVCMCGKEDEVIHTYNNIIFKKG